ncbi:MAG TPA: tripartite tricarboxylate transporter permease [archaeon]|nr:tripartite tricarboxylate transporter permease [archaeon]
MDVFPVFWILLGCIIGIFTGLSPGIHINTVAAFAATMRPADALGVSLMIASMSIVHSFVDFVPSILFGAPEEENFLSVLPGHRMLLKGKGLLAIKLAASGAFFSGLIAIAFAPVFVLFVQKASSFLPKIIPFALLVVLATMVLGEKGMGKKFWAITIIALSALLGAIVLGEKSIVKEPLLAGITGFFGAATIIESLRKKSVFPEQQEKKFRIKKTIILEGSLLGFLAGSIVSILPAIGSNQAAFILKKIFGKISTKKFLVLLGGSGTANMLLGFLVLFAWGKTRNGSAAAISQLIEISAQNILLLCIAGLIALGFGFAVTMFLAKIIVKKMHRINYEKTNLIILAVLIALVAFLSEISGLIAFASATAIGLLAVSKGVKRTNCMAFLMIPALLFYLGF